MKISANIGLFCRHRLSWLIYPLVVGVLLYHCAPALLQAGSKNGFDVTDSLLPAGDIHYGGPARDGIPAIDQPRFIAASQVSFLADKDRVLGIDRHGLSKAYPIKILNYHEIVNDSFEREAIVVSYCPLCGTGMAFTASVDGSVRNFGVSGLLYNNDVLLYDRQTESLWSQLMKQAISGPMRGKRLQQIVMLHTTWGDWRAQHPNSLVLSTHTGYQRDYQRSPYAGYAGSEELYFPIMKVDPRYHPKEMVIGVSVAGADKAYPFAELARGSGDLRDSLAGQDLRIRYDAENRSGRVFDTSGEELPSTLSYWFAWQAFHPDTEVYRAP